MQRERARRGLEPWRFSAFFCTIFYERPRPPSSRAEPDSPARDIHQIGSRYSVEEFSVALNARLSSSPDAEMAVTNLLRFAEASVSKATLFNDLLQYPVYMEVLLKLFGTSRYFADVLVRDPGLFPWLMGSEAITRPLTKRALSGEIERLRGMFASPERRLDGLKRIYRREVLRVGAQDILENADLSAVTRQLSDLADKLMDAASLVLVEQLSEVYGSPAPLVPFSIIGLGKLGGGELNYSSDVDVLFVYKEEGESRKADGEPYTFHEYFNKLAERIIQNLSQPSNEGYLYRVDPRLRPESGAGPLARSLRSFLVYYESRGELWERQMLIKARPVAGDTDFGGEFLAQLEPFVYPRSFFNPLSTPSRASRRELNRLSEIPPT